MIEKIGKFVAKKAVFMAMDLVAPGSGYVASKCCQAMGIADKLGPYATVENIGNGMEFMDNVGDFAKDTARDIFGDFLDF